MASYLVTGSSRGIGLTLVAILASKPASEVGKVFASARSENDRLKKLVTEFPGRVEFVSLDVTSEESIQKAASHVSKSLGGNGLDVLINNAGLASSLTSTENMTDLDEILRINVGGVHAVTRAFLPLLRKGFQKKIMNISSTLGSITLADRLKFPPMPSYKISKAALNMLTVQYAKDLKNEGFIVVAISPGYTQTNTPTADLTPEQSVNAVLDIVFRVGSAETGKFLNIRVPGWEDAPLSSRYDGACPPW